MGNNKMIKTAAAVALGASVVATAVAPGAASAATTYKLKSGKLVNAKTGKVVKGYKVYKSTLYKDGKKAKGYVSFGKVLYKDGKKFTGLRSAKYYKAGKLATGTYKGVYYKTGKKFTGLKSGVYYKSGVKGTGSYKSVYYKNGKKHTGLVGATYYKAGKKGTGSYKGIQYKSGKAVNGLSGDTYYKNGVKASGEVDGVQYFDGAVANGTFHSKLYVDGKVFEGTKEGKLYVAGKVFSGVNPADQKVYVDGVLDETAPAITVVGKQTVAYGALIDEASFVTSVKDNSGEEIKAVVTSNKIDTTKPGNYTVNYTATDKNGNVGKASVEVTVQAPAVESVKAINAEEFQVKFAQPVTNASDVTNYEVTINGTSTPLTHSNASVAVSEDKTTATVRLLSPFDKFKAGDKISLQVSDGVVTKEGAKLGRFASETFTFAAVAPQLVDAKLDAGKTKLVVTFDQPVQAANLNSLVKIDGYTIDKGTVIYTATTAAGDYTYEISLANALANNTTETQLKEIKKAGSHTVTLFDVANTTATNQNPAVASTLSKTFTVNDVETAPQVQSVTAVNANKFFVAFDQEIKDGAFEIEVNKGTHKFLNATTNTDTQVAIPATNVFTTSGIEYINGKPTSGFYVVINDDTTTEENPLYKTTEKSVELNVKISNFKSTGTGLLGTAYAGKVTLAKDANTPKVVASQSSIVPSTTTNNVASASQLKLVFDQAIEDAGSFSKTDLIIKDKDGIIIDNTKYTASVSGGDVVVTAASGYETLFDAKSSYSVEFKKEVVKYAVVTNSIANYSLVANKNDNFTVTIGNPDQSQYKYYAVPTNAVALLPSSNNKVVVDFETSMDKATALNSANYKLDGAALPAGTKVEFYDTDKKVLITLPEGSLKQSGEYRLTVEKSVKTAKDQAVVKDAQSLETFVGKFSGTDNVAPTLVGAKYLVTDTDYNKDSDATKLELSFSEEVIVASNKGNDDVIVVFGSGETAQEVKGTIAADPTDKTKVIFTAEAGKSFNVSQTRTVTILAEKDQKDTTAAITDAAGNKAAAGSVQVTAADKVIDKDEIATTAAALQAAKADLSASITTAKAASNGKTEGTVSGNQVVGSGATLAAAITAAEAVFNNSASTTAQLTTAKTTLDQAVTTYAAAVVQ